MSFKASSPSSAKPSIPSWVTNLPKVDDFPAFLRSGHFDRLHQYFENDVNSVKTGPLLTKILCTCRCGEACACQNGFGGSMHWCGWGWGCGRQGCDGGITCNKRGKGGKGGDDGKGGKGGKGDDDGKGGNDGKGDSDGKVTEEDVQIEDAYLGIIRYGLTQTKVKGDKKTVCFV